MANVYEYAERPETKNCVCNLWRQCSRTRVHRANNLQTLLSQFRKRPLKSEPLRLRQGEWFRVIGACWLMIILLVQEELVFANWDAMV